jgi:putative transposase
MLSPGETILLTLRLAGSLPVRAARELHARRVAAALGAHRRAEKEFFLGFDALLDARTVGPAYLEKEKLAELVAGELLMLEEQGLRVPCFVLLPNHLHAVLHLPAGTSLSLYKATELLHQRTATQARRLLRGQLPPEADFWHPGSHELPVTDEAELARLKAYLLAHPQRLGLPERFGEYPYVYEGKLI